MTTALVVPAHFAKLHEYVARAAYETGYVMPYTYSVNNNTYMKYCSIIIATNADFTLYVVYDEYSKLDPAVFMEVPCSYLFIRTHYAWTCGVCGICHREPADSFVVCCEHCKAKRDNELRSREHSLCSTYLLLKEVLHRDLAVYMARLMRAAMVHRELR